MATMPIPMLALARRLLLATLAAAALFPGPGAARQPRPGVLEIHYIAVGQGGATLIIGPDGTMIMYDFGRVPGRRFLVNYLTDVVGLERGDHIHYAMVSHGDKDHYFGYKDVVEFAGIDIRRANYEPGSPKPEGASMARYWRGPALKTRAGAFKPIPVGLRIPLGDGAEAHVVAANGVVLNEDRSPAVKDENDRSISLFIRYGRFSYVLDGDLGAGRDRCAGHDTGQANVQERVAKALVNNGLMSEDKGVDVLHVAHHGSESSTSAAYFNRMKPKLALISVGADQGTFMHPRQNVVESVLLDISRPACVTAPPVLAVLQTGPGTKLACTEPHCTSFAGAAVGDIVISTDGKSDYTVRTRDAPSRAALRHMQLSGPGPWTLPLSD